MAGVGARLKTGKREEAGKIGYLALEDVAIDMVLGFVRTDVDGERLGGKVTVIIASAERALEVMELGYKRRKARYGGSHSFGGGHA